ncbi:hypothetical protein QOZ80_1BG0051390 [Eleusine coracana subsp. coracana]|nr:hypothetical protein QOZ80_1BG0051390 [Eleusine coracana subsp. coracana]
MELAAVAMKPLIGKLGNLLASELTLEKRLRKDVASLERELKVMYVKLREVAEVPPDRLDEGTKLWASDVRELSYDMADAIDAFTLHVGDPTDTGLRGFLKRMARLFSKGKALHEIAGAVRDAKDLAKELGEIHQRYAGLKLQDVSVSASASDIDPRLMATFTEAADLVGVDDARDELIKVLSNRSEVDVKIVSIVGLGGLGKTTLANAVYDKIKVQFVCSAFVSVSRNPDITRIFKKILHQLDKEEFKDINEAVRDVDQLIRELKQYLQSKRYLIVIDDLWDETNWKYIKCAFPKNTCSSRLIITTRKLNVSTASCSSDGDIIYKMKPLSDDDSLRLFHLRIFHHGNRCHPELEQVSRDILKKCGGVPLAIISIASLLASGKQVKTKDQWLILLNSIGHGLKDSWGVEDMHKILSLSYYDLPSHLKPCLLYLSMFPEDYDIERDRLIWRWIAEGFIQHENTSGYDNLFEIGESYFIELVNRTMIQPTAIDPEGRAQACHVHDIVLDLIRSLSTKEKFVSVWDDEDEGQGTSSHNSIITARRLSILQNTTTRQAPTNMSKLRSFTISNPAIDSMPSLSKFQVLRVLDLDDCDLSKCGSNLNLRHLDILCHLRYLGLGRTGIYELPVEVGKLQFLQTLDVRGCYFVQELPRNLMCLSLGLHSRRMPKGLENLTSLEELTGLTIISSEDSAVVVKQLGNLTRLRILTLWWHVEDGCEALVQTLGNLRKLQSLDVSIVGGCGKFMLGWAPPPRLHRFLCRGWPIALPTLPAWIKNSSLSLTFLEVSVRQVAPNDLQVLGTLPLLRGVSLYSNAPVDHHPPARMTVNTGAFPCARWCEFVNFMTVPSMIPPGAMAHVQHLEFNVRVWHFDDGVGGFGWDDLRMGHLPSLEEVTVHLLYRRKDYAAPAVERMHAALRQAAEDHPNRLALKIVESVMP